MQNHGSFLVVYLDSRKPSGWIPFDGDCIRASDFKGAKVPAGPNGHGYGANSIGSQVRANAL
jgi:hypothetical protein